MMCSTEVGSLKTSCVDKKKKRGRFRNRPNKVIAVIRRFRLFVSILLKYNIIKSCDLIWCELDTQTHTRRKELTSASESRDRLTPRSFYLGTHRSIGCWSISDNRWLSGSAGGVVKFDSWKNWSNNRYSTLTAAATLLCQQQKDFPFPDESQM